MPKQIDHEARKRQVAEAVCMLASEHGVEGVTLRDAAERAGLSMGAVQRSFPTRDAMLLFAVEHVGQRLMIRVRRRLAHAPEKHPAARLEALALEAAMLEPAQHSDARVWLAFVAQAAVSPELAAYVRSSYRALEKVFTRLIREIRPGRDAALEAQSLLALIDGLTTHVIVRQLPVHAARNILEAALTRLRGRR